jgi:hypothetical protein
VTVAVYRCHVVATKQKGIPEIMHEVSVSWAVQLPSALQVELHVGTVGDNCDL